MATKIRKHDGGLRRQYAALPIAVQDGELRVMLITSRETHRWVVPKGWPEKGLSPAQVAEREAYEEAGLKGRATPKAIGRFSYLKRLSDGKDVQCSVAVYPLVVSEILDRWPEQDERQREWLTPAQAALRVAEAGLIELLLDLAGTDEDKISN